MQVLREERLAVSTGRWSMSGRDFYELDHDGVRLTMPRVTSILSVIDKSGPLMGWAVGCERRAFEQALSEVLTHPDTGGHQDVYDRVMRAVKGQRASVREADKAKDIGLAAHKWIEWYTRNLLGELGIEDEPDLTEPSMRAVTAFLDWARGVAFTPLMAERVVYCPNCAYAGTFDCVGKVSGLVMLIDWKTGKAVYPEAHLQNIAYRHAARREGIETDGGLIVRLPKTEKDPELEAVPVPAIPYGYFQSVRRVWEWTRKMDDRPTGEPMTRCAGAGR